VNLGGTFNMTRAVIAHMMKRRYGKIVNVASIAGVIGKANGSSYAAAKAGIISLTMSLAKEMTNYGINVNCVSPGPTATNMAPDPNAQVRTEQEKRLIDSTGWGRKSTPQEVAGAIVFLASDDSRFITGQNLIVGGLRAIGRD
jgi:NAD(P)-dependent dehydrogenase (short-subunit alcohol dehydrogenase family)